MYVSLRLVSLNPSTQRLFHYSSGKCKTPSHIVTQEEVKHNETLHGFCLFKWTNQPKVKINKKKNENENKNNLEMLACLLPFPFPIRKIPKSHRLGQPTNQPTNQRAFGSCNNMVIISCFFQMIMQEVLEWFLYLRQCPRKNPNQKNNTRKPKKTKKKRIDSTVK